ncbi:hypothetical protein AAC978_05815 [Desulfitobacterium sp. THU1]|uniref:hypothetical protein n=1 Tax=Desulfitobacterium sp. THU1 TaxID=3138072 RepID=UPI00311DB55D
MQKRKAIKRGMLISLISLSLLFSFTSISLAEESGQMGGMDMKVESTSENSMSEHEATPDMDLNMEGMKESDKEEKNTGEHGEEQSEGHEEKGETSEGVNWVVVGGFLAINAMIILIAAISKHSNRVEPQQ